MGGVELLLLLAAALVAVAVLFVRRRQQTIAWDRELEDAFGARSARKMPSHRSL